MLLGVIFVVTHRKKIMLSSSFRETSPPLLQCLYLVTAEGLADVFNSLSEVKYTKKLLTRVVILLHLQSTVHSVSFLGI